MPPSKQLKQITRKGATILYDSFVVPTLTRHEKAIDKALGVAQEQATNKGIELSKEGIAKLYQIAAE
ncbi:1626_t:CDS:2, partial [Racocetra fulgida]